MADTMTLEQVLLDMADCQGNRGVGHTYSRLTSWRLAIAAAIKQREQDAKDAARYRWLRDHSGRDGHPYIRCDDPPFEPMDYWITAGTADAAIDAAMAKESGNE